MNEKAMCYEYIIRKAHKVERFGNLAANADIFRNLESHFVHYRDNKNPDKKLELYFKYAFRCGEIATNLSNAIDMFENEFKAQLSEKDIEIIREINSLLSEATIAEIDEAMNKIAALFASYNVMI